MKERALSIFLIALSFCAEVTSQSFINNGMFTGVSDEGKYGEDLAIDENWAVVGAPDAGNGEAYIYKRNSSTGDWNFVKTIIQNDGQVDDFFGRGVAINDDVIIIGARGDDDQANRSGSAYIFYKDLGGSENWGLLKKIEASDASANSFFGNSIDIDNGYAIIGTFSISKAYIFGRDHGGKDNWGEVKQLVRDDGPSFNAFGNDVSIHNEHVVVAAFSDDTGGMNKGSAYIYSKDQGGPNNWGQVKKLVAPDGNAEDSFGSAVALHGDHVVVGAPYNTELGNSFFRGAAYVFTKDSGGTNNWGFLKKIKPDDLDGGDTFGWDLATYGDLIVVGAPGANETHVNDGKAYLFKRNSGGQNNWGQVQDLTAFGTFAAEDGFGFGVHLNHGKVIASAIRNDNAGTDTGIIYFFEEPCNAANIDITNASLSGVLDKQLFTASTAITSNATYDNYAYYGMKANDNLTFSSGLEIENGTELDMRIDFCPN